MSVNECFFETREAASIGAASHINAALENRLQQPGETSFIVSGGSSPHRCLRTLARSDLDWRRVHALLSDERWVSADCEDSNEQMIRDVLLQERAAALRLHPVYRPRMSVQAGCDALQQTVDELPFPTACTLLGMGEDGHFASLFPDAENLAEGLDMESDRHCIAVKTAASPHPRISLTLATLCHSDAVILLFFGAAKRNVYEQAQAGSHSYPVSSLLRQQRAPLHVYWAP